MYEKDKIREARAFSVNRQLSKVLENLDGNDVSLEECVINYASAITYFLEEAYANEDTHEQVNLHNLSFEFLHKLESRYLEKGKYKTKSRDRKIAAIIDRLYGYGAPKEKIIKAVSDLCKENLGVESIGRIDRKHCSNKEEKNSLPKPFTYIGYQEFYELIDVDRVVNIDCLETQKALEQMMEEMSHLRTAFEG